VFVELPPVTTVSIDEVDTAVAEAAGKWWWLVLIAGCCWLLFAWSLLSWRPAGLATIALVLGFVLVVGGVNEIVLAFVARSWRWLHLLAGVVLIGGGITAWAWPGRTFVVLAVLTGWFLLVRGVVDTVEAFEIRRVESLWWLTLISGLVQIGLGFWAVGYVGRSILLLVYWVGFWALFRGVTEIILAFQLRSIRSIPG